ncbi:MAG: hypothetical protein K2X87_00025, partial [Gemmataceae bacterium]|nr:hypothetical protein [Gemmataceae bacterium]
QATAGASATQQSTGRQQQTTGQQSTAQQGGQQQQAGQQSASGQQAGQQQQQQRQRSKAKFSFFRNAQGGRQSASAARKSAVLMATINAFLREVGTTAKLIARKAFVRRPDVVKVLDVDGAYHAFRDRTVKEAFKDLRDDLRRKNTDSWNAVLTLGRLTGEALKKFLAYRRPKVVLKAGTVLLVGREAQQTMSKEQKDRLEALAHKKRFVVRYAKAQQQGQQQQTQQTQTP